jgi:diguanylate cyclase (GGDEF)-like protein
MRGRYMTLELSTVFDEYPNPVYIIRPFVENGRCDDFEYCYAHRAFARMVGLSRKEILGHNFLEIFKKPGEEVWLNIFMEAVAKRKHTYVNNFSEIINKKMYTEVFHIEPDMCGCIVHDFSGVSDDMQTRENEELHRKADHDYLTGFYNRFYLRELYDDIESQGKVGITFVDINNLKKTNDSMGHEAGDDLIKKICGIIREYYADSMIFRMGGDEFLIITTGSDRESFIRMSEECRDTLENGCLAAIGYKFYENVACLRECINECDSIMYEHKTKMKTSIA